MLLRPERSCRNDMLTFFGTLILMGAIVGGIVAYVIRQQKLFPRQPIESAFDNNAVSIGILVLLAVLAIVCFTAWFFYFIDVAKAFDDRHAEWLGWIVMVIALVSLVGGVVFEVVPAEKMGLRVYTKETLRFTIAVIGNVVCGVLFVVLCGKLIKTMKAG